MHVYSKLTSVWQFQLYYIQMSRVQISKGSLFLTRNDFYTICIEWDSKRFLDLRRMIGEQILKWHGFDRIKSLFKTFIRDAGVIFFITRPNFVLHSLADLV